MSDRHHAGHVLMTLAKHARDELGAKHAKTGRALEALAAATAAQGRHVSGWLGDFASFMHDAHHHGGRKKGKKR